MVALVVACTDDECFHPVCRPYALERHPGQLYHFDRLPVVHIPAHREHPIRKSVNTYSGKP